MIPEGCKPIPGYKDYYAHPDGKVWSEKLYRGKRGRWLTLWKNKFGYVNVDLYRYTGVKLHLRLHRVILETFVGPCPEGMEACHNNGDKTNNRLDNLRWDISKNNYQDKVNHSTNLMGSSHPAAKLSEEDVIMIRKLYQYPWSQRELARFFRVSRSTICDILKYRTWKSI